MTNSQTFCFNEVSLFENPRLQKPSEEVSPQSVKAKAEEICVLDSAKFRRTVQTRPASTALKSSAKFAELLAADWSLPSLEVRCGDPQRCCDSTKIEHQHGQVDVHRQNGNEEPQAEAKCG